MNTNNYWLEGLFEVMAESDGIPSLGVILNEVEVLMRRIEHRKRMSMYGYRRRVLSAMLKDLASVFGEPNWDGCGAERLLEDSMHTALQYLDYVAECQYLPDVTVDTNGKVCMEYGSVYDEYLLIKFGKAGKVSMFFQKSPMEEPVLQSAATLLEGRECLLTLPM